jgi:hypothetical protein
MRAFFAFLILFIKIFIAVKVIMILYMSKSNPEEYPTSELIWWSSFLVFDMWVQKQLPDSPTDDESSDS